MKEQTKEGLSFVSLKPHLLPYQYVHSGQVNIMTSALRCLENLRTYGLTYTARIVLLMFPLARAYATALLRAPSLELYKYRLVFLPCLINVGTSPLVPTKAEDKTPSSRHMVL